MFLPSIAVLLLTCTLFLGVSVVDANVFQLAAMIKEVTGKPAIPMYSTYGCYCGFGGKGKPLDGIDWCCQKHDCCYQEADEKGCPSKYVTYHYTYRSGTVKCENAPRWWRWISETSLQCERKVCECDRKFVLCLKKNSRNYKGLYQRTMRSLWGLVVLFVCCVLQVKGSLLEFGEMVKEMTGKNAFFQYTSYGCYCGIGGKGDPVDATDSCCKDHDCCYEKLSDCHTKTDRYQFTIEDGVVTCGEGSNCEKQICECDKNATTCFRDNLATYDIKYRFYLDAMCREGDLQC